MKSYLRKRCICAWFVSALVVLATAMSLGGCVSTERDNSPGFQDARDPSPTPETMHALANILAAQGRQRDSAMILRRLMREHPRYAPAYSKLAELYVRSDRIDRAIDILEAGLDVAPEDPTLHNNLGMCKLLQADYPTALAHFVEATRLRPDHRAYLANRAMTLGLLGRYGESLELYKQFLEPHRAHHNLAVICLSRDDLTRARRHQALARSLKPHPPPGARPGQR